MRAVVISQAGGPEVLEIRTMPEPEPGAGEVRVAVKAAALNRADVLQRKGLYPPPPDAPREIPGLEYAGIVEALGPECRSLSVGDRVMGIVGGGGFAERLVVHERTALRIPATLEIPQAAAIPEAFLTAFDALFLQGGFMAGERVLIHAVGSGVGTAAVQLIRWAGGTTLGTARTPDKLQQAEAMGLGAGFVAAEPLFSDWVKKTTGGAGVDLILDLVGGAYFEENLKSMAPQGRQVVVGLVAGAKATIPLGLLLNNRLRVMGTVLRSRPLEEKIALARRFERLVLPAFEQKRLVPTIDRILPMESIREAHRLLESNASFGKIVMTW